MFEIPPTTSESRRLLARRSDVAPRSEFNVVAGVATVVLSVLLLIMMAVFVVLFYTALEGID